MFYIDDFRTDVTTHKRDISQISRPPQMGSAKSNLIDIENIVTSV